MVEVMAEVNLLAIHVWKVTVQPQNIQLACRINLTGMSVII